MVPLGCACLTLHGPVLSSSVINKHPEANAHPEALALCQALRVQGFAYAPPFVPPASPEMGTVITTPTSWVWRLRLRELEDLLRGHMPCSQPRSKLLLCCKRGNSLPHRARGPVLRAWLPDSAWVLCSYSWSSP